MAFDRDSKSKSNSKRELRAERGNFANSQNLSFLIGNPCHSINIKEFPMKKHQGFPIKNRPVEFASVEQHMAHRNEPLQGARDSSPYVLRSRNARGAPFVPIGAAKKKFRNGLCLGNFKMT